MIPPTSAPNQPLTNVIEGYWDEFTDLYTEKLGISIPITLIAAGILLNSSRYLFHICCAPIVANPTAY